MKKSFAKLIKQPLFKWVVLAFFIRLFLMFSTAHPDLWSLDSGRYFFGVLGKFNLYDYLASPTSVDLWLAKYDRDYFTYPPLSYFTFGFFNLFRRLLRLPDLFPQLAASYPYVYRLPGLKLHVFLFKAPYLVFDAFAAYFLTKLFSSSKQKKTALLLWLFNPLVLYSAYMVGQFELIPVFFVILALYLAQEKKPLPAALALGLGTAYKMFPLFFLPILAVSLGKSLWEKIKITLVGLLPFFVSILPFISSANFRRAVLFSNQSQKFLHMQLPLSGAEAISLFIFLWGLVFFAATNLRPRGERLWFYFGAIMLAFFSVTHYHPQWFVWLAPFLIIDLVKNNFRHLFTIGFLGFTWVIITLLFESSLNYALFVPLRPELWESPSLATTIHRYYDVFQLKTILRSLFAAASLWLVLSHRRFFGHEKN